MPTRLIITIIKIYRYWISPLTPPSCRFTPTCSLYAIESFKRYNLAKAAFLTIKRICRCHPWGKFGYDPVPKNEPNSKQNNKSTG